MPENNWDEGVANLQALASSFPAIQRTALRAVVDVIKPRAAEVTPVRGIAAGGYGPLPEGALKSAVRGRVVKATADAPAAAVVDWGNLSYIANMVDRGHRAPHARALGRAGRPITGKPTPAHPFVRGVQDSTAALAQETFEAAMTAEIEKALQGN